MRWITLVTALQLSSSYLIKKVMFDSHFSSVTVNVVDN